MRRVFTKYEHSVKKGDLKDDLHCLEGFEIPFTLPMQFLSRSTTNHVRCNFQHSYRKSHSYTIRKNTVPFYLPPPAAGYGLPNIKIKERFFTKYSIPVNRYSSFSGYTGVYKWGTSQREVPAPLTFTNISLQG